MSFEFDIRKQNLLWMNVDVIKDEKYKSTVFNIFLKRFSSESQKPKKVESWRLHIVHSFSILLFWNV